MRGWSVLRLKEAGSRPASALGWLTSFSMGEGGRGADGCGGAKGTVPRVIPAFGKAEVRRDLRTGARGPLPACLDILDGPFEIAGTGACMQCQCGNNI